MISVHPSNEITRKIAVHAIPTLSNDTAPWNGFAFPVMFAVFVLFHLFPTFLYHPPFDKRHIRDISDVNTLPAIHFPED